MAGGYLLRYTFTIVLFISFTYCQKISVCKQIELDKYDVNDIKKNCLGQTVFIEETLKRNNERNDLISRDQVQKLIERRLLNQTNLIKQLQATIKALEIGFKQLKNGWVTIFNGYQYKQTPTVQSWNASRLTCKSWGGNLAVEGVQDMGSRRLVIRALSVNTSEIWIGLSKNVTENKWYWADGNVSNITGANLWLSGQPNNNKTIKQCAAMLLSKQYGFGTNDYNCNLKIIGLCEKKLS